MRQLRPITELFNTNISDMLGGYLEAQDRSGKTYQGTVVGVQKRYGTATRFIGDRTRYYVTASVDKTELVVFIEPAKSSANTVTP